MAVIVVGKMQADPAKVQKLWKDREADFKSVTEDAKAAGAQHHRWGMGDGFIVIIDEWTDAASFEKFFSSNATIPTLMEAAGVQGPPEFTIVESVKGPDEF